MTFQFLPPLALVDGYRFYLFDEFAQVEDMVDTGFVAPDGDGIGRVRFDLDVDRSYRVAMTAYNGAGESRRSNTIALEAGNTSMIVDGLTQTVFPAGKFEVMLTGQGFTKKPKIRFEGGSGKRPKAKVVEVVDDQTLRVQLKVKDKRLTGTDTWDMRVRMKDGRDVSEVVVPGALSVLPGGSGR